MINIYIGKQNTSPLAPLLKGEGNSNIEQVDVLEKNISQLFDEIQTPSLFGDKKVFVFKNVFENETIKQEIFKKLGDIKNAPHDVMIVADKLLGADKKVLEKVAEIHESKTSSSADKKELFNPFGLANAFATGDKKKTWIMFQEVAYNSDEMEPIHGMVWWKLKDMILKTKKISDDQKKTARDLVDLYHQSRLGGLNLQQRLEKFFLTMSDKK